MAGGCSGATDTGTSTVIMIGSAGATGWAGGCTWGVVPKSIPQANEATMRKISGITNLRFRMTNSFFECALTWWSNMLSIMGYNFKYDIA